MLTQLLYYLSIWFYVVFVCLSIILIITYKVFTLTLKLITNTKREPIIDYHPDIFLNHIQLMTLPGFRVEEHYFQTEDDCTLLLWRIVSVEKKLESKGVPALFMHGLIDCGMTWFGQEDLKDCFPYVLARSGYDVWIGNNRGTRFTKESSNREGFWNYTFDELARYDITKIIEVVLKESESQSLVFVGHSQGSLQLMAAITEGYISEDKILAFVGLGPVLSVFNNTSSILLKVITKLKLLQFLIWVGFKCTLHLPVWSTRALGCLMCNSSFIGQFGFFVVNLFCGFTKKHNLSYKQQARIFSNQPGGASLMNILHWKQFAMGQKMKFFNHGKSRNLQLYGKETPPEYNLHKIMNIEFHKLVFIGTSDVIMKHSLLSQEYFNKNSEIVLIEDYNHNDYMWSATSKQDVYDYALEFIKGQGKTQ